MTLAPAIAAVTLPHEAVPDAFWKSLGVFNWSRMVLAGVLLAADCFTAMAGCLAVPIRSCSTRR